MYLQVCRTLRLLQYVSVYIHKCVHTLCVCARMRVHMHTHRHVQMYTQSEAKTRMDKDQCNFTEFKGATSDEKT